MKQGPSCRAVKPINGSDYIIESLPEAMGTKGSFKEEEEDHEYSAYFAVNGFYGNSRPSLKSTMRVKFFRVAEGAHHMETNPLPSGYNPGVLGPPATWKTFCRQQEAIKYSQLKGEGLMVFSFEGDAVGSNGKRNYVVSHPRLMWLRLLERRPDKRCSYEVIQEGSVCKLYFDLEFSFLYNLEKDGNAMTNIFIRIVCHFIGKEFGLFCTKRNIVDLESSSFLKFSRHLIFNIPNAAFATNIHVGRFVTMVCNRIRDWQIEYIDEVDGVRAEDIKSLFVFDSKKNTSLFCDEGVYNKNRNFRVLHSTKLGKNTPLVVASENQYTPIPKDGFSEDEQLFLDSLITAVMSDIRVLSYGEEDGRAGRSQNYTKGRDNENKLDGLHNSPYQEIDQHIDAVVRPGYIRCWYYFPLNELLVYEIARNRYCRNIGCEHKNNNILYVVNLKIGTYYQKCHDPDCRDFKSDSWQLPESALFWKNLGDDEMMELVQSCESFDDVEDDVLATAAARAELEEVVLSDEELCSMADKLEMWDNLDAFSR
ncbi:hypothetical protein SK128_011331 [Halocaridina rubra]|uniref:DNA-directed primase/polymerase protein n=1 Tax=Halocaridina rubra TaxID=373956 RepID=A0AAN9ADI7_HALRR